MIRQHRLERKGTLIVAADAAQRFLVEDAIAALLKER
jgi:hypothetical protein